eukprot:9229349-Pyramimonas_sp.AAC.1
MVPLDQALNSRKWQEHLDELARLKAEKEEQDRVGAPNERVDNEQRCDVDVKGCDVDVKGCDVD